MLHRPRIAIIGAGIAGLNAALTLQDAGLSCSIYEGSNRIGGRMHSDTTSWADGLVSEWCGEFIDGDHETLHRLIARFGLNTVNLEQAAGNRKYRAVYFLDRFQSEEGIARGFQTLAPLLQQQAQEAGFPTTYAHYTETGYRLDHLSVYDWIEQYVPDGHRGSLGLLLESACTGYFGLDTHEQSALNLVYMFGSRDLSSRTTIPTPKRGSSKIVGGNERLPLAIAHSLPEDCIQLGHQLMALELNRDTSLTLTFATPGGTMQVQCDHAILTLPFSALRHVDYQQAGFDKLKRTTIEELGYGTVSKLFLQFDQPYWYEKGPWPQSHRGFIITDLDIQTLWDVSLGQTSSTGLLVDYTSGHRGAAYAPPAAYSTTDEAPIVQQYAHHCLQQLERLFPGISAHYLGKAALSYPTGDPLLRGSYSCWKVGQCTRFGGYERVRQGPVHFAGEHCSVEYQGFMEGAASEGEHAAQEIVQDMD